MPYEFIARNGLIAQNNSIITGSLTVTGTITATTLVAQTITSSTSWITGSTKFGSIVDNTHQFTGSILQSGSLAYFAGSVGIGTTSPSYKLDVSGEINAATNLYLANGTLYVSAGSGTAYTSRLSTVYNFPYIETYLDSYAGTSYEGRIYFRTNSGGGALSTKMTITNGGNVGIGTTSPSAELDVRAGSGYPLILDSTQQYLLGLYSSGTAEWWLAVNSGDFKIHENGVSDQFTIKAGGNVGIGTTSPSNKLQVVGGVTATSFTGSFTGSLTGLSSNATSASFASTVAGGTANYIPYWSATNTLGNSIIYQSGGAIGINTTSPTGSNLSSLLHVNGGGAVLRVGPYYSTGGDRDFIELIAHPTDTKVTSPNERFWMENTAGAIVISASAVGINTSSPAATFSVFGKTILGNQTSGFYVSSSTLHIASASVAQITFEDFSITAGLAVSGSTMNFGNQQSDATYRFKYSSTYNGNYATSGTTYVQFNPTTNYISSGNVGIGTTSPSGKLDILGPTSDQLRLRTAGTEYYGIGRNASTGLLEFYGSQTGYTGYVFGGVDGTRMTINSSGNVGIGTSSPSTLLHLKSTGAAQLRIEADSDNITESEVAELLLSQDGAITTANFSISDSNNLVIGSNSTTSPNIYFGTRNDGTNFVTQSDAKLTILNGGNVGIGTTSPLYRLHVSASSAVAGFGPATTSGKTLVVGSESGANYASANVAQVLVTSGNLHIDSTSDQTLYLQYYASTNTIINTYGGNVGIGTSSPVAKLHVGNSGAYSIASAQTFQVGYNNFPVVSSGLKPVASISGYPEISYQNSYSASILDVITGWENTSSHPLLRVSAYNTMYSTPAFIVRANGNVGIGTTNPLSLFTVTGGTVNLTTYVSSETRIADGSIHLMKTSASGVFEAVRAINSDTTAGTTVRLVAAATSDPFNNTNGGKVFIDAIRSATNMDLAFLLNDVGGAAPVERVRFLGSGNVGIGTTSPVQRLEVNGNIKTGTDNFTTRNGGWFFDGNGSYATGIFAYNTSYNMRLIAPTQIEFYTNNSARVLLDSSGNVGIGTTSPTTILHIENSNSSYSNPGSTNVPSIYLNNTQGSSTSAHSILTLRTNGGNGGNPFISFDINGVQGYAMGIDNADSDKFKINYGWSSLNSDTKITLTTGGNVGIGTTSPSTKLEVGNFLDAVTNTITVSGRYEYEPQYSFRLGQSGTNLDWIGGIISVGDDGNYNGKIQFKTANNNRDTPTTKMVIKANGNVGINTTAPGYKLSVNGTGYFGDTLFLGSGGNISWTSGYSDGNTQTFSGNSIALITAVGGSPRLFINSSGNIGIGNTSPSFLLDAQRNTNAIIRILDSSTNSSLILQAGTGAGMKVTGYNYGTSTAVPLYLSVDGANTIMQSGGGNVGIGTTSPAAKLQVSGSTNVVNIIGSGSATTPSIFSIDGNNGRLFEITDDLSDSIFSANTIAGLPVIEAFSDYSVRLGTYSSASGSTVNITGSNVGIGTTVPDATFNIVTPSSDTTGNAFAFRGSSGKEFVSISKYGFIRTRASDTNGANMHFSDNNGTKRMEIAVGSTAMTWYSDALATNFLTFQHTTGNIGIGTTSPAYKLDVSGTIRATGDVIAYSDARVKENVETISDALAKVTSLRGVSYTRKDSEDKSRKVGVIAQEVLDILPEVVQQDTEGNYSVAYGNVVGVLIEAIKELKAEIDILKNK